jgi:arylsulfatase A-like enzyme
MLRGATGPFFLDVGFADTHRVYSPAEQDATRYVRPPMPIPDAPETRLDMARYIESAKLLDRALGIVLDAIDETGLRDNTIVVCTTDHGLAFPYMKCNLTDHGTGVLLIVRGPGNLSGGRVLDALVSQVDLFPTLCDLAGIEHPDWLAGTSLLPVIDGEAGEVNEQVYSEVTFHAAYEPQRMIRTREWTYIRRFADRDLPVLPNCDDGETRDYLLAHGWAEQPVAREQLYNNVLDPVQRDNRIADTTVADIRDDLKARLETWMRETGDPLLQGEVPIPPGGRVNDPDARSFSEDLLEGQADGTVKRIPNPRVNA